MTLLRDSVIHILREAISRETGMVIRVESPGGMVTPVLRAKQVLYRFKSENTDFKNLQIRISPDNPDHELWLIKTEEGQKLRPDFDEETPDERPDGSPLNLDLDNPDS
jgi:ClpP class serine protease